MVPSSRTVVCPPVLPVTLLCVRCMQSEQQFLEHQCPKLCALLQIASQETLITCWTLCMGVTLSIPSTHPDVHRIKSVVSAYIRSSQNSYLAWQDWKGLPSFQAQFYIIRLCGFTTALQKAPQAVPCTCPPYHRLQNSQRFLRATFRS